MQRIFLLFWGLFKLCLVGYFPFTALVRGVQLLWISKRIHFGEDLFYLPYDYFLVGSTAVVLAMLGLLAAVDVALARDEIPVYYKWVMEACDWMFDFIVLKIVLQILRWDIKQGDGYADRPLLASPVFRGILPNVFIFILFVVMTPPWLLLSFSTIQTTDFVSKLGGVIEAERQKGHELPKNEEELKVLAKVLLENAPAIYEQGSIGRGVPFQLKYVPNASRAYTTTGQGSEPSVIFCSFDQIGKHYWLTVTILARLTATEGELAKKIDPDTLFEKTGPRAWMLSPDTIPDPLFAPSVYVYFGGFE